MTLARFDVHAHHGVNGQQLLERDPGQVAADAEVRSAAEGQVARDVAPDVELFGVVAELAGVAVGRPVEHHHLLPCGDGGVAGGDVSEGGPTQPLHRRLEAQELDEAA